MYLSTSSLFMIYLSDIICHPLHNCCHPVSVFDMYVQDICMLLQYKYLVIYDCI